MYIYMYFWLLFSRYSRIDVFFYSLMVFIMRKWIADTSALKFQRFQDSFRSQFYYILKRVDLCVTKVLILSWNTHTFFVILIHLICISQKGRTLCYDIFCWCLCIRWSNFLLSRRYFWMGYYCFFYFIEVFFYTDWKNF